ncbi:MAG: hypothetical protein LIP12_14850 [Clostridiales bacterium]|nr:hypothetical protein [Clostridiales bacterium]
MGKTVQYIVYAVTMCVIYAVIGHLNNRDSTGSGSGQSDESYVVKMPAALKYVYLAMFGMGMILFAFFTICDIRGIPGITVGLIRFSLIVAAIGLLVMIWASRWRIRVDGSNMEIHKLLHRKRNVSFSEIEKVKVTKKYQLILYKNGKKLVIVDLLADNYERLKNSLGNYGKLQVRNER